MNAPHANGCMDTAQKVAFVAQLSLLSLVFHHTSRTQLAWVSEGFGGGKNSGVGSARQPSLTQSKEVDLAAISYVQRAPPSHHPACLGPLCHDSKSVLQVLLREKLSACIECNAERNERAIRSLELGGRFCSHRRLHHQQLILANQLKLGSLNQEMPMIDWSLANLIFGCR